MANPNIKSEVITILDIKDIAGGKGLSILSEAGDRYSFFKDWEGQPTNQMSQFEDLDLENHSIVKIRYAEKPNERKPSQPFRNVQSFQGADKEETSKAEPVATHDKINSKDAQIVRSAISKEMIGAGNSPEEKDTQWNCEIWQGWVLTGNWPDITENTLKSDSNVPDVDVNADLQTI